MKKLLFTALLLSASFASAQNIEFGVKAGLVFNTDKGELLSDITGIYDRKGEGSVGYQLGVLTRIKAGGLYVQPELLYTQFRNEYASEFGDFEVTKKRVDIPVNIGKSIFGIAHIQAGPVFSYYMSDDFNIDQVSKLKQDDFNVGLQAGAGVKLSDFLIDLRYEFGLGKTTTQFVAENSTFSTDSRPQFLNLSLAYIF